MRIDANVSALGALSTQMQVSANNVANMNTNEFQASRADLQTGPQDQGVQVSAIMQDQSPGPLVPSLERTTNPETGQVDTSWQYVQGSNTDLAREFVGMTATQHAYEANAVAIRTQDEMYGTILDIMA